MSRLKEPSEIGAPRIAEFAEQHTATHHRRQVLIGLGFTSLTLAFGHFWLVPWVAQFAESAPCRSFLGFAGITVLAYGLFVGIPLVGSVLLALTAGRRGYKVLRDGQFPPRGEKVFRPTRIRRGSKALLIGYLHWLLVLSLVVLAIWGVAQAGEFSRTAQLRPVRCASHGSAVRAPNEPSSKKAALSL